MFTRLVSFIIVCSGVDYCTGFTFSNTLVPIKVLSVVFQTYIQAMRTVRMRASSVREGALKSSFQALLPKHDAEGAEARSVTADQVKRVLKLMRPHYNSLKVRSKQKNFAFI